MTCAIAACSLLCQARHHAPSPFIIALKPSRVTNAGSSFFDRPIWVSIMPTVSKRSASVAPGIRHVIVIPASLTIVAQREAEADEEGLGRVLRLLGRAASDAGTHHHLDAAVLLVAECLVHLGSLLERNPVRDDERRVDVAFLDVAPSASASSVAPASAPS